MSVLIAIPVFRISCRVGIDKGRGWSAIEEIVLWSMTRQSRTIGTLVLETGLPRQIIVAAIARLMRFRLVEVAVGEGAAFRASEYGFKTISGGNPLPVFPKRYTKRVGFVIVCVSGEFYPSRDVTIMPPYKLDIERTNGAEIRKVGVEGGGPSMSHEANLRRLSSADAVPMCVHLFGQSFGNRRYLSVIKRRLVKGKEVAGDQSNMRVRAFHSPEKSRGKVLSK